MQQQTRVFGEYVPRSCSTGWSPAAIKLTDAFAHAHTPTWFAILLHWLAEQAATKILNGYNCGEVTSKVKLLRRLVHFPI